jgi:hypothetical protein
MAAPRMIGVFVPSKWFLSSTHLQFDQLPDLLILDHVALVDEYHHLGHADLSDRLAEVFGDFPAGIVDAARAANDAHESAHVDTTV